MRQRIKRFVRSIHWLALLLVVVAILAGDWAGGSLQALSDRSFSISSHWDWLEPLILIVVLLICLISLECNLFQ